jgi:hypothetical protein
MTYNKELRQNAGVNYEHFRKSEIKKSKREILEDFYRIHFYENMYERLSDNDLDEDVCKALCKDGDKILDSIFSYYCGDLDILFDTCDNRDFLIQTYISYSQKNAEM